ncbi:MAG: formylglycine-generating enzyme family protein [Planctomycetota bacterium]|nr:MAG: formylglycine-generating enzyme family protein [Planctomycetota bacterium]
MRYGIMVLCGMACMGLAGCGNKPASQENGSGKKTDPPQEVARPVQETLKVVRNSLGMEFVRIPAGTFQMGSPDDEADRNANETRHEVTLTHDFLMGVCEVNQAQYEKVMGDNPSFFQGANLPVEQVSFEDAEKFCIRLSSLPEEKASKRRYRLPTEAEWEYACRAGTTTPFNFGSTLDGTQADTNGTSPYGTEKKGPNLEKTSPVGSYQPNAWGLYNMHGNVWEWCADRMGDYPDGPATDPQGHVNGVARVLRGGSWRCLPKGSRAAFRSSEVPDLRSKSFGIRVVLTQSF